VDKLPGLTALDQLAKMTAATVDNWQDGSAAFTKSAGASVQGTTLTLQSGASGTEWAVFKFTGIQSAAQLQQLKLDSAAGQFSGAAAGYWVAVANYTKQHWDVLGRSSTASYSAPLSGAGAYLSPNNACYIAVLITDGQAVTINRAGLTLDTSPWQRITLTPVGGLAGQTPCIDFTAGNNPAVAWADDFDHHGYFAICDRSTGFGTLSSWSVSQFETNPASVTTTPSLNAKVQWLDLLIDPGVQLPRISLLYTGVDGANNTVLGCTALGTSGINVQWWNWRMASSDGSYYTSIARNASDASYAIVYTAANTNKHVTDPTRYLNDMEYRSIVWTDPVAAGQIDSTKGALYYGFGQDWRNPHLRISAGKSTVVIDGDYAYQEQADLTMWSKFYGETTSLELGSLAFSPAGTPGMSFSYTGTTGQQELAYVGFNANLTGARDKADTQTTDASSAIAEVSQLAYKSDGTPCIAYTYRTAQGIEIRYAFLSGATWTIETVSSTNGSPSNPTAPVYLDLALDANNVAAVCWTQWNGVSSAMVVALRGA